jgi:hypothetical protein
MKGDSKNRSHRNGPRKDSDQATIKQNIELRDKSTRETLTFSSKKLSNSYNNRLSTTGKSPSNRGSSRNGNFLSGTMDSNQNSQYQTSLARLPREGDHLNEPTPAANKEELFVIEAQNSKSKSDKSSEDSPQVVSNMPEKGQLNNDPFGNKESKNSSSEEEKSMGQISSSN